MLRRILKKFNIVLPPLPTPPPPHTPRHATLLQLSALVFVAMLAHFSIAHPFIAFYAFGIFSFKFALLLLRRQTPPQFLMITLTIFSFALILLIYGGWNGQKAGISFLALLSALKFLESRSLRDYYVVCIILYFLAACSFLFSSSITSIAAVVVYTIAVTAILIQISDPIAVPIRQSATQAFGIMAKALPLAIFLFFFFPRVHGSFGFIPAQGEQGDSTELSNSLIAGDFAAAAFNNALAFRVSFDGPTPPNQDLYWRSKVMTIENNFAWLVTPPEYRNITNARAKQAEAKLGSGDYHYEILHEKSTDQFLPYLDYVSGYSMGEVLDDYSVFVRRTETGDFSYRGSASLQPTLSKAPLRQHLLLTTISRPSARTQALTKRWQKAAQTDAQLVNQVLQHFRQNNFSYTLLPPGLGDNPVDEFLFDSQSGYCEHYASVFTTLMRWMGVPARVVVGYQGGERNEIGGYLEVKYSDAHAWSEVYIDEQWRRVDPTAAVSPERVELGMEALLESWDGQQLFSNGSGSALADYLNPTGLNKLNQQLRQSLRNVGYQWNKWVVGYDFNTQQQLLKEIGLDSRNSLYTLVALLFAGCIGLMLVYFWQMVPKPIKMGDAQRIYLTFVARFRQHDITKQASDTPNEFAAKASQKFPHLEAEILRITNAYNTLRYGKVPGSLNSFKQMVKGFKLSEPNPHH